MSKLPVKCPACGGYDTIRTKGPQIVREVV